MRIKLYEEFGALNSKPVFAAMKTGILNSGDTIVDTYEEADAIVIWSNLFVGRMAPNQEIWDRAKRDNKPIVVLEIGNILRGETWRVGLNGINRNADFGKGDIDMKRHKLFNVKMKPWSQKKDGYVVICTQRPDSVQWEGMVDSVQWITETIDEIKKYTNRGIVIRPHPRDRITNYDAVFEKHKDNIYFDAPKVSGQDKVNFERIKEYAWCVVNYCTGPGIQALFEGIPVIVGEPSLAYPHTTLMENIETPKMEDRLGWFNQLCHTEWFVSEIAEGKPWRRLKQSLQSA